MKTALRRPSELYFDEWKVISADVRSRGRRPTYVVPNEIEKSAKLVSVWSAIKIGVVGYGLGIVSAVWFFIIRVSCQTENELHISRYDRAVCRSQTCQR
jgi:hypothetical protein